MQLNANTGTLLWSYTTGDFISYASPSVANGLLYIGSDSGNVYAFGLSLFDRERQNASKRPDIRALRPDSKVKVPNLDTDPLHR
jgi:outer membrane protein assembly factor BamB